MQPGEKRLRIETGVSENKGKGTWNGHITLRWPDRPVDAYYYPGEPDKPFRSAQEASEWCQAEVRKLVEKIGTNQKANRLLVV